MPDLPKIMALEPVTIPAKAEQIYDRWYLVSLLVDSKDPLKATAIAKFKLAGTDANGNTVFHPGGEEIAEVIDNLFVSAATDALLGQIMGDILLVCNNLRTDTEKSTKVMNHVASVRQQAGFTDRHYETVQQALADGTTAKEADDSQGLAAAKQAASDAASAAVLTAAAAVTHKNAAVTEAGASTLPKTVAAKNLAMTESDRAESVSASAQTVNSQVQAL
jgi:hypothetical protein